MSAQAYAGEKNYICDKDVQLQVQYQGALGDEYAYGASISGEGSLDGSYSALGDGVLFVREGSVNGAGDRLDLGGQIYRAQDAGTITLGGWGSEESLKLACRLLH